MRNLIVLIVVTISIAVLGSCSNSEDDNSQNQTSTEKIIAKLNEDSFMTRIVPFSAVPSSSYADLMPLINVFQGKKVIGFGEATHGTHEFNTTKLRMFQLLASELNFKNLTIEDNFSSVWALNDYVKTGNGNIDNLINGLRSSIYKTTEFKDLIVWMRNYNVGKSENEKVYIWGMDAQNTGPSALAIQKYIQNYDNAYLSVYNTKANAFLNEFSDYSSDQQFVTDLPSFITKIQEIRTHIEANSALFISGAGQTNYTILLQHIKVIEQALYQFSGFVISSDAGFERRDTNMAANVIFIETIRGATTKTMIWVHNGHITKAPQKYFSNTAINVLGTNLVAHYGNNFYSVGYQFNRGSFNALNYSTGIDQVFQLQPGETCFLSKAFASYNVPTFFYDLKGNINSVNSQVFNIEIPTFEIGAAFDNNPNNAIVPKNYQQSFDGIIFIENTTVSFGL